MSGCGSSITPLSTADSFGAPYAYGVEHLKVFLQRKGHPFDGSVTTQTGLPSIQGILDTARDTSGAVHIVHIEIFEYPHSSEVSQFDFWKTRFAVERTDLPSDAAVKEAYERYGDTFVNDKFLLFIVDYSDPRFTEDELERGRAELGRFIRDFQRFRENSIWEMSMTDTALADALPLFDQNIEQWEDGIRRLEEAPGKPDPNLQEYFRFKRDQLERLYRTLAPALDRQILNFSKTAEVETMALAGAHRQIAAMGNLTSLDTLITAAERSSDSERLPFDQAALILMDELTVRGVPKADPSQLADARKASLSFISNELPTNATPDKIVIDELYLYRDRAVIRWSHRSQPGAHGRGGTFYIAKNRGRWHRVPGGTTWVE